MSNYTRIVAWNNKDALADTDTAKVISGGDFWTEFGAVATAVNSKADAAGDIGQAFNTSTAAASSNTTGASTRKAGVHPGKMFIHIISLITWKIGG